MMCKYGKRWILLAGVVFAGCAVQAATIDKTNNVDNLNLTTSWKGGVTPKERDVARWSNVLTGPNTVLMGANLSYQGIQIVNPGGTVSVGGNNTLTNGFQGLNLATAQADLILTNAALYLLDYSSQVWNVTNSRTLTVSPAMMMRGPAATMGVQGSGSLASTTITNDVTGLIGPWARQGTGTATKYATVSGGVVVGNTGTPAAAAADVTDTTGTVNYDLAAVGTLGTGAAFHTLCYTGAVGTIAGAFKTDGLLNAGLGTTTFSGDVTVGPTRELVLTSPDATRTLVLSGPISDAVEGASDVTIAGGGRVNFSGNNAYSGTTVIGSGVLAIYHTNALGSTSGNTIIYSTGRTTDGGQLALSGSLTVAEPVTITGPGDGASASYTRALDAFSGTNTLSSTLTLTGTSGYRIGISGAGATVLNLGLIKRSTTGGGSLVVDPQAGSVLNISQAMDNNGGDLTCHGGGGSGMTVLMASSNDLGTVVVQNDSSLKVTAPQALSATRALIIGRGNNNTERNAGNDRGVFYLDASDLIVNELSGYPNMGTAPNNASATQTRRLTSSVAGDKTLTVGFSNGSGSFDGVIENGTGGGTLSLVKAGTGTQTFAGTRDNTYTGITAVNGGALALNKSAGTNAVAGSIVIGPATVSHGQTNQIADTATVSMTNATAKWSLNGKSETVANLDMQNAGAAVNAGFASGVGGKLTVTGTLTHSLGDITLNSSGAGGSAWIDAYAVVNLGGTWTFGANDGTQTLTVGAGGLTIGNSSTMEINAGTAATNAVSLAGDVTSLAAATPNMITGKGQVKLNAARIFDVAEGAAGVDLFIGAKITDGTGTGALTKMGLGTLSLTNANTYTGGTAVNAGTLAINSTLSLPGWNSGGAYSVAANAALAVGNGVSDGDIPTILGTGNFAAGSALGFDTTLGDRTYSGVLNDPSGVMLGLMKVGNNTLTLSGANGYTGHTTINSGALSVSGTGALPGWDIAGRYTVASGAMLLVPNAVTEAEIATMLGTGNFEDGAILGFDTSAGNRNFTSSLANTSSGVLNIYKASTNQLQLANTSSYDGVTTIQKGILRITHANALGSTNGATVIYTTGSNLTGGQLLLSGGLVVDEPITFAGPGDASPYTLGLQVAGGGGSNTLTGPVTITTAAGVRLGANGSGTVLVLKGPFKRMTPANALNLSVGADNGRVVLDTWIDNNGGDVSLPGGGRGVVQFNVASNNIGNMQISGKHELRLGVSDALAVNKRVEVGYQSTWADGSIGTFNLAGCNQTINELIGGGTSNAVTARVVTNSAAVLSTLTVGNGNGSGTFTGVINGNLALTKVGTGTQTLGGPGGFTGDTTVQAGVLRITNALALQQSTLVTSTGAFSVDATLTACTLGGLSGSSALGLTNATGAALALRVGNNNSDTAFSGALSGSGSLVKTGSGKLTLAGVNTYTGATTVEAGTLALGCDGALSTGTQITLNGGTLSAGSFANGLSALSVGASNGTLDVGDGSGALAFANSSGQTWNGTLNITFTGEWNPFALRFGTNSSGLSSSQLNSLRVNGQKTWLMLDAQGYLVRLTGTLILVR